MSVAAKRKVKQRRLTSAATTAARPADLTYLKSVNRWRDQLNPLRGLTVQGAVSLLELGKQGRYADLQWLYEHIEESDPTLIALLERYEGGLGAMDYKFPMVPEAEMPSGGSKKLAEEQAACLREAYDDVDNLRDSISFLMGARFRGYAHLEKWRDEAGDIIHLEPVPQWYWVRDGVSGDWEYNREARSGTNMGEPVLDLDSEFIIRERKRPVNRLGLLYYVYRNLGLKDWAAFVETYGIPPVFLIQPPNIAPDRAAEYQAIAEAIIADARGSLPNGSDVKTIDAGARNQNPFRDFLSFLKEELVLAGTGGKLTMLAEAGSGTLAGTAHQAAWEEVLAGEASQLSEVFQKQFDADVLEREFPGQPRLASFELGKGGEEEDSLKFKRDVWTGFLKDHTVADVMANLVSIRELTSQLGLPVNEEYQDPYLPVVDAAGAVVTGGVVRDAQGDIVGGATQGTTGAVGLDGKPQVALEQPTDGSQPSQDGRSRSPHPGPQGEGARAAAPYRNRVAVPTALEIKAREQLARAVAGDLQPLLKRLAAISEIEDPEILKNRLTAFQADLLNRLKSDVNADPASARVLEETLSAALFNGMAKERLKARG